MTAALLFSPRSNPFESISDRRHNIGIACRDVDRDHERRQSRTRLPPKTPFKTTASRNKTQKRRTLLSLTVQNDRIFGVGETQLQLDIGNPSPCKKRRARPFNANFGVDETQLQLDNGNPAPCKRRKLSAFVPEEKKVFYQNLGLAGTGSFSNVYQVRNVRTQNIYALKKTNARVSISEALNEVKIVQLLQQEWCKQSTTLETDACHPHVISLVDYWITWDKRLCQLYEYYQHGTLLQLLQHNVRLNQLQILQITQQLCVGLEFVHRLGIVHLDLKPENIFVSKNFQIKIGDFGISVRKGEDEAGKKNFCSGDPIYISPELVYSSIGRDTSIVTRKSDIFSLGIILLELLCDVQAPSTGKCFQNLRQDVINFEEVVAASPKVRSISSLFPQAPSLIKSVQDELQPEIMSDIGAAIQALCKQMLQSTSAHRPECAEILQSIAAILNNAGNAKHFKPCFGLCALSLPSPLAAASVVPKRNMNHVGAGRDALRCSSCPVDESAAEPRGFHQESAKDLSQLQPALRASSDHSRRRPFQAFPAALRFSLEDADQDEDDDLHL